MQKLKHKERILTTARGKQLVRSKGTPIILSEYFSAETLQARRECHYILEALKELPTKNTLSSKVVIQNWKREKKIFR